MLRSLGRIFVPACALFLAGCTGSSFMGMEVSDYRAMFGGTGDQQILVNILNAKDGAPLHFTELQTLGATNQMTTSFSTTGQANKETMFTGTIGAQASPTFGLATLDLQAFTQGLMNTVNPFVIQQFFEEGVDQRLILLLFFSAIVDGQKTYLNNLKCDRLEEGCLDHFFGSRFGRRYFPGYLNEVNHIAGDHRIVARIYYELTRIGAAPAWSDTAGIKDLAGIDVTKYRIEPDPNDPTKVIVYQIGEPRLALCRVDGIGPTAKLKPVFSDQRQGICENRRTYVYARPLNAPKSLVIRSTYEIIEYLGQVLAYQEATAYENRCIQLGVPPEIRAGETRYPCDRGDVLFQVNPARGAPLVTAGYQGRPYTIGFAPCDQHRQDYPDYYCDHSAEVLKIVNLLININKSATNFTVPTVRITQ